MDQVIIKYLAITLAAAHLNEHGTAKEGKITIPASDLPEEFRGQIGDDSVVVEVRFESGPEVTGDE